MEDDKRKKKQKKKKKQAPKTANQESTSDNQSHVPDIEQDNNGQVSVTTDVKNDFEGNTDVHRDGFLDNGTVGTNLATADKQYWIDREASFEEKIRQLEAENDAQIQKEAFLEEKIKELLKEKDEQLQKETSQREIIEQFYAEKIAFTQKEASLNEKLRQLEEEKNALIQREDTLEEKIKQFQREKDAYLQKEVDLELKIQKLEGEKDSWVQKEADFVEKIKQLVDESAALNLKGVSLQEKIEQMELEKYSWIQKENSAVESLAALNDDNIKLKAQVLELVEMKKVLVEENQKLTENASALQSQINNPMESKMISEVVDTKLHIESAAHAQVENLVSENRELVNKVTELSSELENRGVARTEDSFNYAPSADVPQPIWTVGSDDPIVTVPSTQSLEDVLIEDEKNHAKDNSDVIVQIPLEDKSSHVEKEDTTTATNNNLVEMDQNDDETTSNDDVSFTEAPLIGAPFRIISYFARYVSGADLVQKK